MWYFIRRKEEELNLAQMMKVCLFVRCPECRRIAHHGKWVHLTEEDYERLDCRTVQYKDDLCPDCEDTFPLGIC